MWNGRESVGGGRREEGGGGSTAVAIDRGKASRYALKWALENVIPRDHTVKLIHVLPRPPSAPPYPDRSNSLSEIRLLDGPTSEMLLPFRCYCMRRQVQCEVVVIEDLDVAKGLVEFVSYYAVENLFLGAASKSFSRLFKNVDTPSMVMKSAPDFCNIYVIGKGKITSVRTASRPVPMAIAEGARLDGFRQLRRGSSSDRAYDEISTSENEILCVDSGRLSTDSNFLSFYENLGSPLQNDSHMHWGFEEQDFEWDQFTESKRQVDIDPDNGLPAATPVDSDGSVLPASNNGLTDEDTRRLTVELQRTMDMYHAACKEAIMAKQTILELGRCKMEAERKMRDAQLAERAAMSMMEKERARCQEALEVAETARWLADRKLHKQLNAEMQVSREAKEKRRIMAASGHSDMVLEYKSLFHISVALMFLYVYFCC